ncbi:FKBP-type peptidyl-prolyl cis-trans isomerase [Rhizohabitans arisaemae]|uniref:FKBP-type peptidyl-prolyl cis-trans isomerase n=1 Tax=Rhizohabitans arisaemae TaxID=2720610 RepID=UPI0024B1B34F|nr:FKBP-type peptidyl-prolyl cis-trans isomerase [Rhizohabitans arisaemae]
MRRLALLAAVPLLFATACGGSSTSASSGSSASSEVTVTGEVGKKPQVTFPAGDPPVVSSSKVLKEGQGTEVKNGDQVVADVTVFTWDGKTNGVAASTYDEGNPQVVKINETLPDVVRKGFEGRKPGSRFYTVVAKDALPPQATPDADAAKQAQVFVVDVLGTAPVAAVGEAADAKTAGVKLEHPGGDKPPTLTTKTEKKAPAKLVAETVIKGGGPPVKSGDSILVHYTGKIWGSGDTFDSSWERGQPILFEIGTGKVIKGWDQGLVGVPTGSRVLLSIPPDLGYGKAGSEPKIKGTDTLVFVVDVLGAY